MATHSNILVWKIPWTEEPGGLQSRGSQRVEHEWDKNAHYTSFLFSTEVLARAIRQVKNWKKMFEKEQIKLSLFLKDIYLCKKNKTSSPTVFELEELFNKCI